MKQIAARKLPLKNSWHPPPAGPDCFRARTIAERRTRPAGNRLVALRVSFPRPAADRAASFGRARVRSRSHHPRRHPAAGPGVLSSAPPRRSAIMVRPEFHSRPFSKNRSSHLIRIFRQRQWSLMAARRVGSVAVLLQNRSASPSAVLALIRSPFRFRLLSAVLRSRKRDRNCRTLFSRVRPIESLFSPYARHLYSVDSDRPGDNRKHSHLLVVRSKERLNVPTRAPGEKPGARSQSPHRRIALANRIYSSITRAKIA